MEDPSAGLKKFKGYCGYSVDLLESLGLRCHRNPKP